MNVSSIYGRTTTPLTGWNQTSKHALEAVSDALSMEVAGDGIQVVLVEPRRFRTAIWDDNQTALSRHEGSKYSSSYDREQSLLRLADPFLGGPVASRLGHRKGPPHEGASRPLPGRLRRPAPGQSRPDHTDGREGPRRTAQPRPLIQS